MIDPGFGWKFAAKFSGIVLAALCGTALALYIAIPAGSASSFGEVIRNLATADDLLGRAIIIAMAVVAVGISAAVGATTVLTFHKIAGPVYRLKVGFGEIACGREVRPIRLRRRDQLREAEEAFNGMAAGLDRRFRCTREVADVVSEAAARTAAPVGREQLKTEVDRLGEALRTFRR